jgi:hypothetical protein
MGDQLSSTRTGSFLASGISEHFDLSDQSVPFYFSPRRSSTFIRPPKNRHRDIEKERERERERGREGGREGGREEGERERELL